MMMAQSNACLLDSKIKFYILLSTYNRPNRALRAVKSVLNQRYTNYELIIYNDGSDQDYSDLESLVQTYTQVHYIKNHDNHGANYAKNVLLDKMCSYAVADNDYFFILDDDDYLTENALVLMTSQIQKFSDENWFAFDVYSKSPEEKSNHLYSHEYQRLSYSQYRKKGMRDDHFVWKRSVTQHFRYPNRFFKNGYEHLYYFQLPMEIILVPAEVKVIEYYPDGLTKSKTCNNIRSLPNIIKHIILQPREKVYYYWLWRFCYKSFLFPFKLLGKLLIRMTKKWISNLNKK